MKKIILGLAVLVSSFSFANNSKNISDNLNKEKITETKVINKGTSILNFKDKKIVISKKSTEGFWWTLIGDNGNIIAGGWWTDSPGSLLDMLYALGLFP